MYLILCDWYLDWNSPNDRKDEQKKFYGYWKLSLNLVKSHILVSSNYSIIIKPHCHWSDLYNLMKHDFTQFWLHRNF